MRHSCTRAPSVSSGAKRDFTLRALVASPADRFMLSTGAALRLRS